MSYRLWYSQLDVYDAMRRLCLLLSELKDNSLVPENYISQIFFLHHLRYCTKLQCHVKCAPPSMPFA